MSKELKAISDGTFVLTETDVENQFLFFREDHGVLEDIDDEPMDFYHDYIARKMFAGEITGTIMGNVCLETSADNKTIRLTVSSFNEFPSGIVIQKIQEQKKPNVIKRFLNKLFG